MRKALSVAALVASTIIATTGIAAEPLGRLFFTPAQRDALDSGKYSGAAAALGPRTIHVDGVVTRSDAERTVWINGRAYHDGSPDGVQVKTSPGTPASTSIRIAGKTATTRVKVGQRLDLNSDHIQEDFARRPAAAGDAGVPLQSPALNDKKSKTGDAMLQIPRVEKQAKKSAEEASDEGRDAPATVR